MADVDGLPPGTARGTAIQFRLRRVAAFAAAEYPVRAFLLRTAERPLAQHRSNQKCHARPFRGVAGRTYEVIFINGGGWAPKRATLEFFRSKGGIDLDGPLSPVVPAAPAALLLAMAKYGKLKREQVLVPAIELAERGFVVSENLQGVLQHNVKRLQGFPSSLPVWFRGGQPLQMGDVVIRKNLGQTLRRIAANGRDGFYKGPVAENTVQFLARNGGIMEASDLDEYEAEVTQPLHVRYRGYDVYAVGLPTQGPVMLEALKILEGFDLKAMGHNSADYIHHVIEAEFTLSRANGGSFCAEVRIGGRTGKATGDDIARTISLAIADAIGSEPLA